MGMRCGGDRCSLMSRKPRTAARLQASMDLLRARQLFFAFNREVEGEMKSNKTKLEQRVGEEGKK